MSELCPCCGDIFYKCRKRGLSTPMAADVFWEEDPLPLEPRRVEDHIEQARRLRMPVEPRGIRARRREARDE